MKSLIGTGVALVTPFNKDFSVDAAALKKLLIIKSTMEFPT